MTLRHRSELEAVHSAIHNTRGAGLRSWGAYLKLLDWELRMQLEGWVVR